MFDIVFDTHIVIWYFADPTQLSKLAEKSIDEAEQNRIIFVPLNLPLIIKDHHIQALRNIQTKW